MSETGRTFSISSIKTPRPSSSKALIGIKDSTLGNLSFSVLTMLRILLFLIKSILFIAIIGFLLTIFDAISSVFIVDFLDPSINTRTISDSPIA